AAAVDGVEVAPVPDIAEHDGVHDADRAARLPTPLTGIGDRLAHRGAHRADVAVAPVGAVAAVGHEGDPGLVVACRTVSGVQRGRGFPAQQPLPERLDTPSVSGDGAETDDARACSGSGHDPLRPGPG